MSQISSALLAVFLIFSIPSTMAQEEHAHDTHVAHNHEAHVHGQAELHIILDGHELQIELHSPAMNLVGFEHKARSEEELARIENSKRTLADGNELFSFEDGECELLSHQADFGNLIELANDNHEHESHSEVQAQYRYECDQIVSLTTSILAQLPGIESLQVQWIANGRQGAFELNSNQNRVLFE